VCDGNDVGQKMLFFFPSLGFPTSEASIFKLQEKNVYSILDRIDTQGDFFLFVEIVERNLIVRGTSDRRFAN
jgi:hypothetical protein